MENKVYEIMEANMERLEKKLTRIANKCKTYGCEFHYEKVGETFKDVCDDVGNWHYNVRFIKVEAYGKAIINDWEFVAVIEHTKEGNIITGYGNVEVPEKYYTTEAICEHCESKRRRKNTYVVRNTKTGEFKQIGKSCLKDYTSGLSAEAVAAYISCFDELIVGETYNGNGYGACYVETEEFMKYVAEVINKFGDANEMIRVKTDYYRVRGVAERAVEYYIVDRGGYTGANQLKHRERLIKEMENVNFNANEEKNVEYAKRVLEWVRNQKECTPYFKMLLAAAKFDMISDNNFWIMGSAFKTYIINHKNIA